MDADDPVSIDSILKMESENKPDEKSSNEFKLEVEEIVPLLKITSEIKKKSHALANCFLQIESTSTEVDIKIRDIDVKLS